MTENAMAEIIKTKADFAYMGGSFVVEPADPSGFLSVPIAPGSPRVAYWPCSATIQQNTHPLYVYANRKLLPKARV